MPQFRLTEKIAKVLKIKDLSLPQTNLPEFCDDWILDVHYCLRKKIIIAMHVETRMGIAVFPPDIGGINGFFSFFPFILKHHLYDCGLQNYADLCKQIDIFFGTKKNNHTFTKTKNLSVNAHITQFKEMLEFNAYDYGDGCVDQRLCDYTSNIWLGFLIKIPPLRKGYTTASERWQNKYNGSKTDGFHDKIIPFRL